MPHETVGFRLSSTHSKTLQAWEDGDISLDKMAELLDVDKKELGDMLADMNLFVVSGNVNQPWANGDLVGLSFMGSGPALLPRKIVSVFSITQ